VVSSNLSAVEVAREHGLDEGQTEELQRLVIEHLLKCSAACFLESEDGGEDYQRHIDQLERLIEAASGPVCRAFEDYLNREISGLRAKATA